MGDLSKLNILIVDDRPANLDAMEAALADMDVNVVKAQSGKEALTQLLHLDFALVVLDMNMSMIDGFDVLKLMKERERTRNTPVIFATASHNLDAIEKKVYARGAIDLLGKPLKLEVFRAKVKRFVELFKEKAELQAELERLRSTPGTG